MKIDDSFTKVFYMVNTTEGFQEYLTEQGVKHTSNGSGLLSVELDREETLIELAKQYNEGIKQDI